MLLTTFNQFSQTQFYQNQFSPPTYQTHTFYIDFDGEV